MTTPARSKRQRNLSLCIKGSTIEISSQEHAPDEWSVFFEIPATLFRSHITVRRIIRSAFMTRDDALEWARKEIDDFVKASI